MKGDVLPCFEDAGAHVEGRRTWFDTIEEMQRVLDDYIAGYNHKRPTRAAA